MGETLSAAYTEPHWQRLSSQKPEAATDPLRLLGHSSLHLEDVRIIFSRRMGESYHAWQTSRPPRPDPEPPPSTRLKPAPGARRPPEPLPLSELAATVRLARLPLKIDEGSGGEELTGYVWPPASAWEELTDYVWPPASAAVEAIVVAQDQALERIIDLAQRYLAGNARANDTVIGLIRDAIWFLAARRSSIAGRQPAGPALYLVREPARFDSH